MIKSIPDRFSIHLFIGFSLITLLSLWVGFASEKYLLFLVPIVTIIGFLAVVDFKKIYYLLFLFLPLSIEYEFSDTLATDLPTEPLMIGLMFIFICYIVWRPQAISKDFFWHPVTILIIVHVLWVGFLMIHTENVLVTVKFFLAKIWYVIVFFFMAVLIVKWRKDFIPLFWLIFIPLLLAAIITIIRHFTYDFKFDNVNDTVTPYFRNHVNYAAMLTLFLPFVFFVRRWYEKKSFKRRLLNFGMAVFLLGIFFAYTRGAWLALIIAVVMYVIIEWRILKFFIIAAVISAVVAVGYMFNDNKYLSFAPDFETTVYHKSLDAHLQATMGLEDVSSAERVYRWVAAFHMFADRPLTGFGPGNFFPYYKHYTVSSFETYISDNEERSTVHNYFLLLLVEQGFPGFLFFTLLVALGLITGERVYHETKDKKTKEWVMAIMLMLTIILVQNMLSDLIEVDKTGTLFFFGLALLIIQDIQNNKSNNDPKHSVDDSAGFLT